MTSDKSGPVRTAASALEGDLETTRDRKDVPEKKAPAEKTTDTESAGAGPAKGSNGSPSNGRPKAAVPDGKAGARPAGNIASEPVVIPSPAAEAGTPEPAPAPPAAPEGAGSTVPTTGGVWRSAYEAGRSDKGLKPAEEAKPKGTTTKAPGHVPATGRASEKSESPDPQSTAEQKPDGSTESWNRVPGPDAPETTDGVKAGAMRAAHAALDAARSAAKKVSSIMPDEDRPTPAPSGAQSRPEMHYTAGAVRGTATSPEAATETPEDRAGQPGSSPTPEATRPAPAGPRRVRLAISRVDPWSVMKLAFLLAVAIAIMTVVATAVFWSVLNSLGVFTAVQKFVVDAVGPQSNVNLTQFVEFPRVISLATLISICNIVLLTAIATIMAFLYNITAALVGGVHMTLTDD